MTAAGLTAASLFRTVGLMPDGPAVLGRPVPAQRPGVYVVELPAPRTRAPVELTRIGKWLEGVPTLMLDGERPTSKQLAARLAGFWIPSATTLFVGSTSGSIGGRVAALERHVLGDPRPHAASQWLHALDVTGLRVWWAATSAPEEYEDALLEAFGAAVPADERAGLRDTSVVLPFANLRTPSGSRKAHGLTGSTRPDETPVAVPTHVVELPPGDAEGARQPERNTGTRRRTQRPAARTPAPRPRQTSKAAPPPVVLTSDGLARLNAELDDLVRRRRPEIIARVKSARELGDLRENAEYTSAREEQSFLEGRIQSIEAQLRTAVAADAPADTTRVGLGSRVTVDVEGDTTALTIVGPSESDPANGRISTASPVGRALLGRAEGEEALVRTPGGEVRYRVIAIG